MADNMDSDNSQAANSNQEVSLPQLTPQASLGPSEQEENSSDDDLLDDRLRLPDSLVPIGFSPLTDFEDSEDGEPSSPPSIAIATHESTEHSEQSNDIGVDSDTGEEVAFDIQLPYQHLYLARNFQAFPGHKYLAEGSIHILPVLSSQVLFGVGVLIPGQTIPLNVTHRAVALAMRESLDKNQNIFAFFSKRGRGDLRLNNSLQELKKVTGVTLEIFEIGNDQEGRASDEFCCKARVTQRIRILDFPPNSGRPWLSWPKARVVILSEVVLPHPLHATRGSNRAIPGVRGAELTAWPHFVYDQYNIELVMQTAKKHFLSLLTDKNVSSAKIPNDPVQFSFWILINFPMSDSFRCEMLSLNNSLQRLNQLIEYFKIRHESIRCALCLIQISRTAEVFSMSASGPQLFYTNPSGFLHETITLYNVENVHVDSVESKEYSWFPGYAWKVASCKRCHSHVGWQYVARRKSLVPKTFFGITKRAIVLPGEKEETETPRALSGMMEEVMGPMIHDRFQAVMENEDGEQWNYVRL